MLQNYASFVQQCLENQGLFCTFYGLPFTGFSITIDFNQAKTTLRPSVHARKISKVSCFSVNFYQTTMDMLAMPPDDILRMKTSGICINTELWPGMPIALNMINQLIRAVQTIETTLYTQKNVSNHFNICLITAEVLVKLRRVYPEVA